MTTTKTKPDLSTAYAQAIESATELRLAQAEHAAAEQGVRAAKAVATENARRATVTGVEHEPDGSLERAAERVRQARERIEQHRENERDQLAELAELVRGMDAADAAADLRQIMAQSRDRYAIAVDQIAAAREHLQQLVLFAGWVSRGTDQPLRLGVGVAGLASSDRLPNRAGEAYTWAAIDAALLAFYDQATKLLERALAPKPEPLPSTTAWDTEMLQWHVARGGSVSDSVREIRTLYLEHGPRREHAARDMARIEQASRTQDQRTWGNA